MAAEPGWVAPVRLALAGLPRSAMDEAEAAKNADLLERALRRRAAAAESAGQAVVEGTAAVAAPPPPVLHALTACLRAQDVVVSARLGLTEVAPDGKRRFEVAVLALRMDPQRLRAAGLVEDDVSAIWQDQVEQLVLPSVVVATHASYTTESAAGWQDRLAPIVS
jgi:hypothetical protein